jgi:thioredoxin-like negative regulator of GroEL
MLKGKVKLGKVNCDDEPDLKSRFEVSGFPTIKVWESGVANKMDQNPEEYTGGRLADNIRDYGLKLMNQDTQS